VNLDTNGTLNVASIFASVQSFVGTTLLPAVAGFVVLSISIALGIKTVRRYGKKLL
jgi:hypothetical protein